MEAALHRSSEHRRIKALLHPKWINKWRKGGRTADETLTPLPSAALKNGQTAATTSRRLCHGGTAPAPPPPRWGSSCMLHTCSYEGRNCSGFPAGRLNPRRCRSETVFVPSHTSPFVWVSVITQDSRPATACGTACGTKRHSQPL